MIFNCGLDFFERAARRRAARERWHNHFAWLPVTVSNNPDGTRNCAWLQTISRKGSCEIGYETCFWAWEYRLKGEEHNENEV